MVVALGQQLVLERLVIGELAVEGEGKPLGLAAVVPLERLGIAAVVAAAGGVADVADRERAVDPLHDRLELLAMVQAKRFGDRAHFLVGLDQRTAVRAKAAHAGGELAAVLHVQQHSRNQSGHAVDIARDRRQRRDRLTRGMVDGSHAAFVVKLTHRLVPPRVKVRNSTLTDSVRTPDDPSHDCLGPWRRSIIMSAASTDNLHERKPAFALNSPELMFIAMPYDPSLSEYRP